MSIRAHFRSLLVLSCSLLASSFTPLQRRGPSSFTPVHRGYSRFFLDSAYVEEWMQLLPSGIFHGVTTNPQLLERAKEPNTIENIHRLADIALNEFECNEFMCQAWGGSVEEIVQCALWLVQPFEREQIVVKVPITEMGLQAANILIRDHDIRVCLTACYHRKQALSAVGVGAEYVAPYLGRMTEVAGKNGTEECMEMQDIVSGLGSETRVLVASIREPDTLAELASYGMDTFTFSAEVARKLFFDSWTEQAAREFEASALKNTEKIN